MEEISDTPTDRTRYAGFWVRFLATLVDVILGGVIILPLLTLFYGSTYFSAGEFVRGPADFFITWVLPGTLIMVFWAFRRATPGKMFFGILIADARTGGPPSAAQIVLRYFCYYLSGIPLGAGFLWVAFDRRKQGLHDKLAKTMVIWRDADEAEEMPDAAPPDAEEDA